MKRDMKQIRLQIPRPRLIKCVVKFCRCRVDWKKEKSNKCSKHRSLQWRMHHPLHYAFANLKHRAKERGHAFRLTREQFVQFAHQTGYRINAGKGALFFTIDRIRSDGAYELGNIQILTSIENVRKEFVKIPNGHAHPEPVPELALDGNGDPDWSVPE